MGRGSFGVYYKVRELVLGTCVMKSPKQNYHQLGSTKDALFLQRRKFLHCVMLNHPNIVSFYRYVHKTGCPNEPDGFLMKFMQGRDMFSYLQHDHPIPPEALNSWAKQIAQGLSFMHHRGRDYHVAKISGFGLAKKVETADINCCNRCLISALTIKLLL